jgi:hypothetical protein
MKKGLYSFRRGLVLRDGRVFKCSKKGDLVVVVGHQSGNALDQVVVFFDGAMILVNTPALEWYTKRVEL